MSCITHQRHLLNRDGTGQKDRLPFAFDPAYARIDERSEDELLKLVQDFSRHVQFYNSDNQTDGSWEDFFLDFNRTYEPHLALLLTFLKLFSEAQKHINTFTKRHLDHYYTKFLQIRQQEAVSDRVHLVLELAKNSSIHKLPKGTAFSGGKDKSGKELIYKTEREIILNKAEIDKISSVFIDKNENYAVYYASAANSDDGFGKEFKDKPSSWFPFGRPQLGLSPDEKDMKKADIGFAIASPLLKMKEGKRSIQVSILLNEINNGTIKLKDLLNRDLNDAFTGWLSGEKGWLGPFTAAVSWSNSEKKLLLTFAVNEGQDAITEFDKEILPGNYGNDHAILQVILNKNNIKNPYQWAKSLIFNSITLKVVVEGISPLILQNDRGMLDHTKPFQPFGSQPQNGSAFYIGSDEAFTKQLSSLTIRYKWKNLPEALWGFPAYYKYYNKSYKNEGFKARLSCLKDGIWKPENNKEDLELFELLSSGSGTYSYNNQGTGGGTYYYYLPPVLKKEEISRKLNVAKLSLVTSGSAAEIKEYGTETKNSFLKLQLSGQDFGHKEYPSIYTRQSILLANELQKTSPDKSVTLPNEPYTPEMEYILLDYSGSDSFPATAEAESLMEIWHIDAFGENKLNQQADLLPQFNGEGNMFIGLKNLLPPQQLSVLFKVAEDSANPDKITDDNSLEWSYLSSNGWQELTSRDILSDSTKGLISSGIVTLNIPSSASNTNNNMPTGLHWLRLSCKGDVDGVNKLVEMKTQAVTAVFEDQDNESSHYEKALEKEQISKMQVKDHNIKKVTQPFASFGGKQSEKNTSYPASYYARVSERLRHKQRAVTLWDYERLVLEQFPNIYKVKALNHSSANNDIAPGHVSIVLIEQLRNKEAVNPLQPGSSRLIVNRVKEYLMKYVSPFTKIFVQNPVYEQIHISVKVAFKKEYDAGYYQNVLNEDIKKFLSPWAYEEGKDIIFGGVIYKSSIYHFVEKRGYVDFLMDFRMSHIKPNWGIGCMEVDYDFYVGQQDTDIDVDKAEARTSRSILVSANDHQIDLITDKSIMCSGDNMNYES